MTTDPTLFLNQEGESECDSLRQTSSQYQRVWLKQHGGKQPIDSIDNEAANLHKVFEIYEQRLRK